MSRYINPLLIDNTAYAVSMVGNYTSHRPSAAETSLASTFAEQLQVVQSLDKSQAVAKTGSETQTADASSTQSTWRVDRSAAENVGEVQDFTFDDFIDIINPLQHIPILSTVYREMTGDEIKPAARIAGDVAFGALTGSLVVSTAISVASAAFEASEGEEPLVKIADALFGMDDLPETNDPNDNIMLASAEKVEEPAAKSETAETQDDGNIQLASAEAANTSAALPASLSPDENEMAPVDVSSVTMAEAFAKGKQPFGGVMDPALLGQSKQVASAGTAATAPVMAPAKKQAPTVRLGHTIYTSPLMNREARLNATQAAKLAAAQNAAAKAEVENKTDLAASGETPSLAESLMQSQSLPPSASLTSPALMSVPGTEANEDRKLGRLMHQSATTASSGNTLPPELVHDMMLMALDKYKTAEGLAPSEMTLGALN